MYVNNKAKFNIKKRLYYVFLFLILIYIMAQTIYLLSALIINTNIYDNITNIKERNSTIASWMTGKLISYIVNAFMVVIFLAYISLGRIKMKMGYIFCTIWILIFVGLSASMHVLPGSHDETIRLTCGVVGTIASSIIILTLLSQAKELFMLRRIQRNKMYKTYKMKQRGM